MCSGSSKTSWFSGGYCGPGPQQKVLFWNFIEGTIVGMDVYICHTRMYRNMYVYVHIYIYVFVYAHIDIYDRIYTYIDSKSRRDLKLWQLNFKSFTATQKTADEASARTHQRQKAT